MLSVCVLLFFVCKKHEDQSMVLSVAWVGSNSMQEGKVVYPVYRIALPKGADVKQGRDFEQKIAAIRQVNPGWVVVSDWVQPGEKKAYVLFRKDKDYAYRRALYSAQSHLVRTLVGGYSDKP